MNSFRRSLLGEPEPEPDFMSEINDQCSLSFKNRIIGFGICMGLALFFCILSIFFVASLAFNPSGFAVPYTFGNILALGGTFFIVGPCRQIRMMFKPDRIVATLIYIAAMAGTLWAAFGAHSGILVLLFVIIQFCAITWYVLSYIPYARTCVKNCFCGLIGSV